MSHHPAAPGHPGHPGHDAGPKVIDLDQAERDFEPGTSLADILRWAAIGEEIVTAITEAMGTGQTTVPVIKVRLNGKEIDLGPTPLRVS